MTNKPKTLPAFLGRRRLAESVRAAGRGLLAAWRGEQNFRLEVLIGMMVAVGLFALPFTAGERIGGLLLIGLVLSLELVNTAVERLADLLQPRLHPLVSLVKNTLAAALLVAVLVALIGGLVLFLPYLLRFFLGSW